MKRNLNMKYREKIDYVAKIKNKQLMYPLLVFYS